MKPVEFFMGSKSFATTFPMLSWQRIKREKSSLGMLLLKKYTAGPGIRCAINQWKKYTKNRKFIKN